jgi:putative RNA 2'-phosphotransferase
MAPVYQACQYSVQYCNIAPCMYKNLIYRAMDTKNLSKFLSLVLRHQPQTIGLQLDENGWASTATLLQRLNAHGKQADLATLKEIVAQNDKQRFRFNEDFTQIRANQGHSIDIELALPPATPPDRLFHGTATKNIASIQEKGLLKGSRQHVHLSAQSETAIKVGQRHGTPIVLTIKTKEMAEAGILFYVSDNGVWLTDHVAARYIEF